MSSTFSWCGFVCVASRRRRFAFGHLLSPLLLPLPGNTGLGRGVVALARPHHLTFPAFLFSFFPCPSSSLVLLLPLFSFLRDV